MDKFFIYIPSKSRSDCLTAKKLKEHNIDFKIVIEPQDYEEYVKKHSNLLILNRNNQGISYVRQSIINYAKSLNQKYIWMIDDDITEFWFRKIIMNV